MRYVKKNQFNISTILAFKTVNTIFFLLSREFCFFPMFFKLIAVNRYIILLTGINHDEVSFNLDEDGWSINERGNGIDVEVVSHDVERICYK